MNARELNRFIRAYRALGVAEAETESAIRVNSLSDDEEMLARTAHKALNTALNYLFLIIYEYRGTFPIPSMHRIAQYGTQEIEEIEETEETTND